MKYYPCPGCQRLELHKKCPAHGTPFYCTGIPFTKEVEEEYYSLKKGLLLPKILPENLPKFSVRIFICYYEQDAEKFKSIVIDKGGKFEKYVQIDFLNFKNQPVGFGQYVCIYQFHTNIEMEVLT